MCILCRHGDARTNHYVLLAVCVCVSRVSAACSVCCVHSAAECSLRRPCMHRCVCPPCICSPDSRLVARAEAAKRICAHARMHGQLRGERVTQPRGEVAGPPGGAGGHMEVPGTHRTRTCPGSFMEEDTRYLRYETGYLGPSVLTVQFKRRLEWMVIKSNQKYPMKMRVYRS